MVKTLFNRAMRHVLFLAQSHPEIVDNWGYHIRPIHYYEPIPDFNAITSEQLERRREFRAIDFRWEQQLKSLRELASYRNELEQLDNNDFENDYFAGFDAAVYYALIRHLRPRRVIEIGSGYSTRFAHKALTQNSDGATLTCIEPNPDRLNGLAPRIELIQKRVEEIDVDFFTQLEANDILFIDSSHTVKFGSDVCYEFLDVLPVLRPGVWVHVHDIFFPHDYPAEWILKRRLALNEQYLLEAFLSFNREFEVALANHWLTLDHPDAVNKLWASKTVSSSFWFYRKSHDR
ncbi:MAG TPA: class I SAM-dependent methyltransferase [Pyrinomonadaceae bacterium]|nr:class I SAM-dependent methyltransferase [Pyrinomonadaceae bacterium]